LVIIPYAKCKHRNGFSVSRMDGCQSMMTNVLDDSTGTTTKNVAKVWEAILKDRRRRIHDVCNISGPLYRTCQRILSLWAQHAAHCSKIHTKAD
jgi:hypothetical protein